VLVSTDSVLNLGHKTTAAAGLGGIAFTVGTGRAARAGTVRLVVRVVGSTSNSSTGNTSANTGSTESTTNRAGLTLEAIEALLTTSENTTLLLEVSHADNRESRGGVVLSSVVVNLVDGNSGVDDGRLDGFYNEC